MNTALATTAASPLLTATEELTTAEWARLLVMAGISGNEAAARRIVRGAAPATRQVLVNGGMTNVIAFNSLPEHWRTRLAALRDARFARDFAGLLRGQAPDWQAPVRVEAIDDEARAEAVQRREAMAAYFGIIESGRLTREAIMAAQHRYESLTGERVSERTVAYWAKRVRESIGAGGKFVDAPLEAFARWNKKPHEGMQLINRLKKRTPDSVAPSAYDFQAFLATFRSLLTEPGIELVSAAHTRLDMLWRSGEAIPGLGRSTIPGHPLPFTQDQLRSLAPSKAMRVVAAQGKFRALADGRIARLRLSSVETPLLAEVQFDDTRCDFKCRRDSDGLPVTLRLYVAIEVSTRMILAWTVKRFGNFTAADTAALLARAARNAGLGHADAGGTLYKLERGIVAMPNDRRDLLMAMYPGRLRIERTGMVGGANLPGDFAQEGKGAFWHKGIIEAFNKAFGFLSRWIPGQTGSDWRKMPAMLGTHGEKRDGSGTVSVAPGSQLALAAPTAAVAHLLATMDGEHQLDAREEERRYGLESHLLYESDALDAIAQIVHWHNAAPRAHRMEGDWRDVWVEKSEGGRLKLREAPEMKFRRLFAELDARGVAPQRITEEQAALWLLRGQEVTCTAEGVTIEGRRYFRTDSLAIHEAMRASNGRAKFTALVDEAMTGCIWVLENSARDLRSNGEIRNARLLEVLPFVANPDRMDKQAVAAAGRATGTQLDAVIYELARNSAPRLARQDEAKRDTVKRVLGHFSRIANDNPEEAISQLGAILHAARMKPQAASEGGAINVTPIDTETERAELAKRIGEEVLARLADNES